VVRGVGKRLAERYVIMATYTDDDFLDPLHDMESDAISANDSARDDDDADLTADDLTATDLAEPPADDAPRSQAIPPPPLKGTNSELRLKRNPNPLAMPEIGTVFVWGQGDAYDIPRDVPPPSDLSELHPQLRDTVKPGRVA
jgi:hypothetical protein